MIKDHKILGDSFVKFINPNDNEWVVNRVVDLTEDQLKGIVDRCVKNGKVIFVYDRHNPKDSREIVGEIEDIKYDNGIIAGIKWNEFGEKILAEQSRYPSVELAPNEFDDSLYELMAVAMVGEPASKDVDLLELTSIENKGGLKMDEMIKEIIGEGMKDPESMRIKLTELVTEDPTKASLIIDAIADTFKEYTTKEDIKVEELDEEEVEEVTVEEDEEEEGEELAKEELKIEKKEDKKAVENLTALAYEFASKHGMGVPTAKSLSKAIDTFKDLMNAKKMKNETRTEIAFKELRFVKASNPVSQEELSAFDGKANNTISASDQLGNFFSR